MIAQEKPVPNEQENEEEFAERLQMIADDLRAWTKGEGSAVVQPPGEAPRNMTIAEVREAKRPRRH